MRIELDLPIEQDKSNIYIMRGIELVAMKRPDEDWQIKVIRCNKCGKCCMKINCEHLYLAGSEHICKLGSNRPFECCINDGGEDCNIVWSYVI